MAIMLSPETVQTAGSIAYVGVILGTTALLGAIAHTSSLPRGMRWLFFWLTFDALIHIFLEGPFVYLSVAGRTEYSHADTRWATADPGIVAVELLTAVLTGPLAAYTAYLVQRADKRYHVWLMALCIAELYGDYMTFVPEWLVGSPSLDVENALHMWFYLAFSNGVWVVIPLYLLCTSGAVVLHSCAALREDKRA
ncbi:hypothetical protein MSPP1_003067 [Malassezia sp. CBS 17886]|nr:hypothetical protein MSPP1_003067 [Malassezia sp. CBS 17886]